MVTTLFHFTYVHPPIPLRHFDWFCCFDSEKDDGPDITFSASGETKLEAAESMMADIDESNAPKQLIELWEDWLRDDHGSLHQDDDRDELWEKFEAEIIARFAA